MNYINTDLPPERDSRKVADYKPSLLQTEEHHLCPGCGEPTAIGLIADVITEFELQQNNICIFGHGCYGTFISNLDVDATLCLHGRAPAVATGMKRMRPDSVIWTLQGDGDMASEGLAEVLHTAARGDNVTCFMLNNGVFGDTGGQMTAATVVGQRTKNTLEGRDPAYHGYPISVADLVASLPGSGYVARGSVHDVRAIGRVKRMIRRGFECQMSARGFSLVEIHTMCPTGWFVPTREGAEYMAESLGTEYPYGELKNTVAKA